MHKNLALLSMLLVLAGCNGFSGFDDDGRDSNEELPPQNLSGHVQKGIMQNAEVRVLGVNSQGRLDTDEEGIVSGPISFTGDDGGYLSAISGGFKGQLVVMVRPRFEEQVCKDRSGCKDIYGKAYAYDAVDWPNSDTSDGGVILTKIVCDAFDGCFNGTATVNFGDTYQPKQDFVMLAAVADFKDDQSINVTPLTNLAANIAGNIFAGSNSSAEGVYTKRTVLEANSLVANLLLEKQEANSSGVGSDIDIVTLRPADLRNPINTAQVTKEAHSIHYALANAAIERLANSLSITAIEYMGLLSENYFSQEGLTVNGAADDYSLVTILTAIRDEKENIKNDPTNSLNTVAGIWTEIDATVESNFDAANALAVQEGNDFIVAGNPTPVPQDQNDGDEGRITLANAKAFVAQVLPWMENISLDFKSASLSGVEGLCSATKTDKCITLNDLIRGKFVGIDLEGFTSTPYSNELNDHLTLANTFKDASEGDLSIILNKVHALWMLAADCAHGAIADLTCANTSFTAKYSNETDIYNEFTAFKALNPTIAKKADPVHAGKIITTLTFNAATTDTRLELTVELSDNTDAKVAEGSDKKTDIEILIEGKMWYGNTVFEFINNDTKAGKINLYYKDSTQVTSNIDAEPESINIELVQFGVRVIEPSPSGLPVITTPIADLVINSDSKLEAEISLLLDIVDNYLVSNSDSRYNVARGSLIGQFIALDSAAKDTDILSMSITYSASNTPFYYPSYASGENKFPPLFNFFNAPSGVNVDDSWNGPDGSVSNDDLLTINFQNETRGPNGGYIWISTATLEVPGTKNDFRLLQPTDSAKNYQLQVCSSRTDINGALVVGSEVCPPSFDVSAEMNTSIKDCVPDLTKSTVASGKLKCLFDEILQNDITNSLVGRVVVTGFGVYEVAYDKDFIEMPDNIDHIFKGKLKEVITLGLDNINIYMAAKIYKGLEGGEDVYHEPLFFDYNLTVPALDLDECGGARAQAPAMTCTAEELASDSDGDNDDIFHSLSFVMGFNHQYYDSSLSPIPAGGRSIFAAYSNKAKEGTTSLNPALGSLLLTLQDKEETANIQKAEALVFATISDDESDPDNLNPMGFLSYRGVLYGTVRDEDDADDTSPLVLRYTDRSAGVDLPSTL